MARRKPARYRSPLRKAQQAATRERILDAVAAVIERGDEPTYTAVAGAAQIQERTVYRHFPTKDELYAEFWQRVHDERIATGGDAKDLSALRALVRDSFAGFSRNTALVRGMLHSREGRAIRLRANEDRRKRHERVAASELPRADAAARRRAAAAAQVLCSAMAWEYLHDYWGMDTEEAIATVDHAVSAMFRGLRDNTNRKDRT